MVKNSLKETYGSEMPYEKFLKFGPESLSEAELLAVILRTGTRSCSAVSLAGKILSLSKGRQNGLNALHHITLSELMEIPGIGEVKAVKIKCIAELSKRMARERAGDELRFDLPATVASYFMEENKSYNRPYQMYVLRKDEDGNWKILVFYQVEGDSSDE